MRPASRAEPAGAPGHGLRPKAGAPRRALAPAAALLALVPACAPAPAAPPEPPRPAPPAQAASTLGDGERGEYRSDRFDLRLPLPDARGFRVEDGEGPWLIATHAASSTSLLVRTWREDGRASRAACEARAALARPAAPRRGPHRRRAPDRRAGGVRHGRGDRRRRHALIAASADRRLRGRLRRLRPTLLRLHRGDARRGALGGAARGGAARRGGRDLARRPPPCVREIAPAVPREPPR